MLHLVGSSVLLYLIDDARSNKNQDYPINRLNATEGASFEEILVHYFDYCGFKEFVTVFCDNLGRRRDKLLRLFVYNGEIWALIEQIGRSHEREKRLLSSSCPSVLCLRVCPYERGSNWTDFCEFRYWRLYEYVPRNSKFC